MEVGDLVRWCNNTGVIIEVYQSKCWRTDVFGNNVNWGSIKPEPFARILVNGFIKGVPQTDLEVIYEGR